ncbi:hypothetical protein [Jannaschia sp. 2305UL9-9]|uniref:hypothetical protein n=1 Tax=Jannaschia sp. 2305UL9-9 TaxID=3121638 RepID=UPI0035284FDC
MIRQTLTAAAWSALAAIGIAAPAQSQNVLVQPQITGDARAPLSGQRVNLARDLAFYGYRDVDVRSLSNAQVAQIDHLVHSGRSNNQVRSLIGSTLRRGIISRRFDR